MYSPINALPIIIIISIIYAIYITLPGVVYISSTFLSSSPFCDSNITLSIRDNLNMELVTALGLLLKLFPISLCLFLNIYLIRDYFSCIFLQYGSKRQLFRFQKRRQFLYYQLLTYPFRNFIHNKVSRYLQFELNPWKHSFAKYKCIIANVLNCLYRISRYSVFVVWGLSFWY